jgi:hypothetical protein
MLQLLSLENGSPDGEVGEGNEARLTEPTAIFSLPVLRACVKQPGRELSKFGTLFGARFPDRTGMGRYGIESGLHKASRLSRRAGTGMLA